jgi:hypothetical protein
MKEIGELKWSELPPKNSITMSEIVLMKVMMLNRVDSIVILFFNKSDEWQYFTDKIIVITFNAIKIVDT